MAESRKIFSERCWIDGRLQPATISYSDGLIRSIQFSRDPKAIDMGNAVLMPGVIDAHVHVNEPGRTSWEGFETATSAAAAGGITTIVDMPLNASPVTTSVKALEEKKDSTLGKMHVNVGFYAGLVPHNIQDLGELLSSGVLGIKCFLTHSGIDDFPNVSREDIEKAMPFITGANIPLLVHCELSDSKAPAITDPRLYAQYLASRPDRWEVDAIAMMIELCAAFDCQTHIVHVSSAEALPLIRDARARSLKLTAETCPHYIFFDAEDIPDGDSLYKCAPPIRGAENNRKLREALADGTLDLIASDHSPAPPEMKCLDSGDLKKAWGGIAGLQFLLPASWTTLKGELPLESFIPLLTSKPAAFLGLKNKGGIITGHDADFVIWNPEQEFTVTADGILHRYITTPYLNRRMYGNVQQTIVNGNTVFDQNKIIEKNKGKWVLKK